MFARLAAVSTLAFAAIAAAGSCNTGPIQCCNTVADPTTQEGQDVLAGLLGVVISGLDVVVGLECTSIPIVGIDASNTWCVCPHRFRSSWPRMLTAVCLGQQCEAGVLRQRRGRYARAPSNYALLQIR